MSPRDLHKIMMGATLVVALIVSLGVMQPAISAAMAQHGQHGQAGHGADQHADMNDPEAHFQAFADALELSDEQRHALYEPFHGAMAAMQQLHEFHGVVAEELTEAQQAEFAEMMHEMLGSVFGGLHGAH